MAQEPQEPCEHSELWCGTCARCGAPVARAQQSAAYVSLWSGLSVSRARACELRSESTRLLRTHRKLALVLDLDETLVHTVAERDAAAVPPGARSFRLGPVGPGEFVYVVWPRPRLAAFLQGAAALFELHLYTMGNQPYALKPYALKVCEIIDPTSSFFKRRIISKDDNPVLDDEQLMRRQRRIDDVAELFHVKQLIPLMGEESAVVVVDDRSDAQAAAPEDRDTALTHMLNKLARVHAEFFRQSEAAGDPDVREIIRELMRATLRGAHLVFSGLIPMAAAPQSDPLWAMAQRLGAACCTSVTKETTHVVAKYLGTDKTNAAARMGGVHVVSVEWLLEANRSWTRPSEDRFQLPPQPHGCAAAVPQRVSHLTASLLPTHSGGCHRKRAQPDAQRAQAEQAPPPKEAKSGSEGGAGAQAEVAEQEEPDEFASLIDECLGTTSTATPEN
eukprot:m51a1_g9813 hypothetical protein (447) ;mRNA; r:1857076-1859649